MEVNWRKRGLAGQGKVSDTRVSQLAAQVYINSGWSEMTATHKNVNEDVRDEGDV